MAWRSNRNYQKKIYTYKDYLHWNLNNIIKKETELEDKINIYKEILKEAENLKEATIKFREDFGNKTARSKLNKINLLVDKYRDTYAKGKNNIFEKFATSEKFKPGTQSRLYQIREAISKELSELKNMAKNEIENIFNKFGNMMYPFVKEINGTTHFRGIDPVKENIKYYDYTFELNSDIAMYVCDIKGPKSECIKICERNIAWSKRDIEAVERFLIPVQKARAIIEQNKKSQDEKITRVKKEASKYKAHSYAFQQKTRDLSEEVKKEIKNQVNIFPVCPYCEHSLGLEPHADHIYPVTLGGLGTKENMVYVCASCNQSKGALTLREFIKKKELNRDRVENNLTLLQKKF